MTYPSFKQARLVLCLITLSFICSCSADPENINLIPEESSFVVSFDLASISSKGKLDEITEFDFFKYLKKEVRSENKQLARMLDNFVEDPASTGIDFSENILLFQLNEISDERFICFSAELSSANQFSEFLDELIDEFQIERELANKSVISASESSSVSQAF